MTKAAASAINPTLIDLLNEGRLQDDPVFINDLCESVKCTCRHLLLSGAGDVRLSRLINFHLKGISALPDTLYFKYSKQFNILTDHIVRYYKTYVNRDTVVSPYYHRFRIAAIAGPVAGLLAALAGSVVSFQLKQLLTDYLTSMIRPEFSDEVTVCAIDYFEQLTDGLLTLAPHGLTDKGVSGLLIRFNFNHLEFLSLLQDELLAELQGANSRDRSLICLEYHARFAAMPHGSRLQYHPDWPSLRSMLLDFVREIMVSPEPAAESITEPVKAPKIGLNLPVSQLACWLKLYYEEGFFLSENLSELFRLYVGTFSSKRQQQISTRSLSKEFYALDQFTAAMVRDQLQRMLRNLNQHFFPVWAAAAIVILFG